MAPTPPDTTATVSADPGPYAPPPPGGATTPAQAFGVAALADYVGTAVGWVRALAARVTALELAPPGTASADPTRPTLAACAADPHLVQRTLDTLGAVVVPAGVTDLAVPLFASGGLPGPVPGTLAGDLAVTGAGPRSVLRHAGPVVLWGFSRGRVSDAHYTPLGYRTLGDTVLHSRGTEWGHGPLPRPGRRWPEQGWPTVTRLTLDLDFQTFDPPSAGNYWTAAGENTPLAGLTDAASPVYGPQPMPWFLYAAGTGVYVALRLCDGSTYGLQGAWQIPPALVPLTADRLSFRVTYDAAAGTVTAGPVGGPATLACAPAAVLPAVPGAAFRDPGGRPRGLHRNSTATFGIVECGVSRVGGRAGYNTGRRRDWLVRTLRVTTPDGVLGELAGPCVRPATYPGGPSLPLVPSATAGGGTPLIALTYDAGDQAVGRLADLTLDCRGPAVGLRVGRTYGFAADRVTFQGGLRGVQYDQQFDSYPVVIRDCVANANTDCGLFTDTAFALTVTNLTAKYYGRCAAEFVGGGPDQFSAVVAPGGGPVAEASPGVPAAGSAVDPVTGRPAPTWPDAVVVQRGGAGYYDVCRDDIESDLTHGPYAVDYAVIKVYPGADAGLVSRTAATVSDRVSAGVPPTPVVRVYPRPPGLTTANHAVTVTVAGVARPDPG